MDADRPAHEEMRADLETVLKHRFSGRSDVTVAEIKAYLTDLFLGGVTIVAVVEQPAAKEGGEG